MQSHEQNYFTLIFKLEHAIPHGLQMYASASPWQGIYLSYQMNLFAAFFLLPLLSSIRGTLCLPTLAQTMLLPELTIFGVGDFFPGRPAILRRPGKIIYWTWSSAFIIPLLCNTYVPPLSIKRFFICLLPRPSSIFHYYGGGGSEFS